MKVKFEICTHVLFVIIRSFIRIIQDSAINFQEAANTFYSWQFAVITSWEFITA